MVTKDSNQATLLQTIQDLSIALQSTQQKSQKWTAWQQLQQVNDCGITSTRPYTIQAIAILEAAYQTQMDDCALLHHLAIAYHAFAWDLETNGSPEAAAAWAKALFYWRKLQACHSFWQTLQIKGASLDNTFEPSTLTTFRQNLSHYLLQIHVAFVRYYHEQKQYDEAERHIQLIKQARIPPAVRKKFQALAYEMLATSIPQLTAEGQFAAASAILDSFLDLFPNYLLALQTYIEIGQRWLNQLAPASQWPEIIQMDGRVEPYWEKLAAHNQLQRQLAAQTVLNDFAVRLGQKLWIIAENLRRQRMKEQATPFSIECDEYQAYGRAIIWLQRITDNPDSQQILLNVFLCRSEFLAMLGRQEANMNKAKQLLDIAFIDCEKALKVEPDHPEPRQLAAHILEIKAELLLNNIPAGLNRSDFNTYLQVIEQNLIKATHLDPENSYLQEKLKRVQKAIIDSN